MSVNLFVEVFTAVEVNPIGLTSNLSFAELYLRYTETDVPIPTDCSEFTLRFTISPLIRPCAVETATFALIFSTLAVT